MPLHPNRLRWIEKQITIHLRGTKGDWKQPVWAKVYGDVAVFKAIENDYWSATAVQTGLNVCYFRQERDAQRFAEELQRVVPKALRQKDPEKTRHLFPQHVYDWVKACYWEKSYLPLVPLDLFA